MPIPTLITDLSQTAASNYPAGSDSPAVLDDTQRAHAAFIAQLRDGKGFSNSVTIASSATTDIGGQNSQFIEISGTTTITSFGSTYNGPRYLRFTGALTLTHNASTLSLPGGANITTAAGDNAIAFPNAALNGWIVIGYFSNTNSVTALNGGQLAGLRNRIINGGMTVSQRGSVAAINNSGVYGGADRTFVYPAGFTTASGTIVNSFGAPQSSTGYYQALSGLTTTGTGNVFFSQRIESINTFDLNSKPVTVSCRVEQYTGTTQNAYIRISKATSPDNWIGSTVIATSSVIPIANATSVPMTFTTTLGSSDASNGLMVEVFFSGVGAITSKNFVLYDFQLEIGPVATPFEQRPYGLELALCQRYLPAINSNAANYPIGMGQATLATISQVCIQFPVKTRVPPTGITTTAAANFTLTNSGGTTVAASSISFAFAGIEGATLAVGCGVSLTAGNATQFRAASAGQQILFTGCEL